MRGRILGSVLIVTGTTVGAAILALPLVTAELGFLYATLLLVACWAVMTLTAFLILHVNLAFQESANFSTMAHKTLGRVGQAVTWFSFLMLLYALTAAYITGGGVLLQNTWVHMGSFSPGVRLCGILFTVILGGCVCFGTRSVDLANRVLIALKALAFVVIIALLFPHIQLAHLWVLSQVHYAWLKALPILVTSFGFHIVIPSIRDYLHSDVKKIKRALFIGSLIPLIIYLLWEGVMLGVIPVDGPHGFMLLLTRGGGVPEMINVLQLLLARPWLSLAVNIFTDIAITTSFLGVSMSLLHFIMDGFHFKAGLISHRLLAACMTFFPPLFFAWFYPKGFLMALNYASSFVVILLVILPVLMCFRLEKLGLKSRYPYHLNYGLGVLLILLSFVVIAIEVLNFS